MSNFNIDYDREKRTGFPEVIYGYSKSTEDLLNISNNHLMKGRNALITKLQKSKAVFLSEQFPNSFYDEESGIFILKSIDEPQYSPDVAIISGGTSDIFIVNEIYYTLAFMGVRALKISDVGVSGVHRLLKRTDELKSFKILIVVAGFEGALPTVVGGLLPQPVIAVPTDVGYGVAKGGQAALNSMLASCSNGITVVNINNGYGAAISAIRILNLMKTK
ncbi:MAG: nickel pincer cofactor biosynthesis protein LarB [Bacteroidetes bacterium]|nr:MAG: nickel pincer cofactor biosynthesis protein LarB [Bacteroidota bacterium]